MIAVLIRWSVANRFLVLLASALLAVVGAVALLRTPLDALPDLSDVQVIIRTGYPGQAPRIVEQQVTYPLSTAMLSVPGARDVRGYSFFGDSYVYVIFEDGVDLYWARSRVLEYLNQVDLPEGASPRLGPDATGVGWIYQYALVDRSGRHDLSELRALQDWFLGFELRTVEGVAEVATVGGMVREYQVVLDPDRLRAQQLTVTGVIEAIAANNAESGGGTVELGEAEYMVRASGYLDSLEAFSQVPLKLGVDGVPVVLGDVARVQLGPALRRGIAELDGEGEVVGGIVVMRQGENALAVIRAVKARLQELRAGLPDGVEIVPTYDRSGLIDRAVANLGSKLVQEFIVVALVCLLFLLHLRSALVAVVALPLGILAAFAVMRWQGISANIMSLGGIAIAIGAMVDAAIVMIENAHRKLELWRHAHGGERPDGGTRWALVVDAATEVGPALFASLLIITLSFVPVFALQGQEGRLFSPLAWTKTLAMAAAAGLSVTLVPVLMGYLIRGRIPDEARNPLNRILVSGYRPVLRLVLRAPLAVLVAALLLLALTWIPYARIGGEFLPPMEEGDLLYMPTTLPGLSVGEAAALLQQTDKLIASVPEVARVFGKIGRADTATDPAPLTMIETTVQLRPRPEWREGLDMDALIAELDRTVQIPGVANLWVQPIRNRLDMLSTGIKSPVGIKISGQDLATLERLARQVESVVREVPGVSSAVADRAVGGRYIDVDIDRAAAGRYGLSIQALHAVVGHAVGGAPVGHVVDGLRRFPISVRYPRELRDSVDDLQALPVVTAAGATVPLGAVARISVAGGPPMIRSENARPSTWIHVDVRGRDLASAVADMQQAVAAAVALPAGYAIGWSGQFEHLQRARARLALVVPVVLVVIFVLLYLTFRRADDALLVLATIPFALIGGVWLMWALGHAFSVATAVGFIALAGVAAEFGVVMLLYLRHAWNARRLRGHDTPSDLDAAIEEGAVLRVRPKAMTVAVILAGLAPIMFGSGAGSEIMQRIAAPMVGGMITAPLLSMLLMPAAFRLLRRGEVRGVGG